MIRALAVNVRKIAHNRMCAECRLGLFGYLSIADFDCGQTRLASNYDTIDSNRIKYTFECKYCAGNGMTNR